MTLTWLWVIVHYIFYAHLAMITLHDMLITMLLPCIRDPCFALHMMIDSSTCMCICKLGGDIACYFHVCFVPHSHDDTMIMFCVRACDMSCALSMPIICSHDMIAMISSSVLHLHSTSLLHLIASHTVNNCSVHCVDCHTFFTTPYAHCAWIVLHLPHVFRHFISFGVVNDSYAYHRPFVERFMHVYYDLRSMLAILSNIFSSLPHICMLPSMMSLIVLNLDA